ncbi:MAG: GntR family transcriptional regulator [Hydrogenophaga sp.]|jgi:GntR family transcriptional regulator|uniref:GntR family transcriptional regulator n=1 Tax=Hydrogenophaga sp. TaxID=1904254 RepID=UPI00271B8627|nr:GntR family transcriptional regulator [Hydrogenophaga sp.]MDO9483322.1 GntR family transcriptional regulator [Hydrogenophaga sp.]MDP3345531.1 GntR family transcriptional regulator [Hydrogenophaga sp.]MDP3925378.1 GntR family transcriptional regulator [Hydrogenophaga sp.]MDZ4056233.1 GntR family transcriptional regulator [Polynucleobacter sp.]
MPTILRRDSGDLLHRQLFLALREQIRRGVYRVGDHIPTDEQLCQSFGVSRITVRRAVADLVEEGWVERRIGRGTFVKKSSANDVGFNRATFTESLAKRSKQTQVAVLEVSKCSPPPHVAAAMGLSKETQVLYASRLRSISKVPLLFVDSWVLLEYAGAITVDTLKARSISEMLLSEGVRFRFVTEELFAVAADPHVATHLQVQVGAPLLSVARLVSRDVGKAVMYLTAYMTSERSRIVFNHEEQDLGRMYESQLIHDVNTSEADD